MNRVIRFSTLAAFAGLILGAIAPTHAAFSTGTQGLADVGTPMIAGGPTLSTATSFTFGNIFTTTAETGAFMTTPSSGMTLGSASLSLTNPTAFTFGTSAFGMFTTTSVLTTFSSDQTRSFFIMGMFVSGTNFGTVTTNTASFNVSFTANSSSSGTSYSDSGTLSVPALAVPEPASLIMLGLGLAGVAGAGVRRRRAQ